MAKHHIKEFGVLIYTGLPELSVMQFSNAKHSGIKNHVPLMAL